MRGVNYGQIFYGADNLAGEDYEPRNILSGNKDNLDARMKIISLALECGIAIDKKF